jgi:hypothetical protein
VKQPSAVSSQPSAQEEAAGSAAYEAFYARVRPFVAGVRNITVVTAWEEQSTNIRAAWIEAAKAAIAAKPEAR